MDPLTLWQQYQDWLYYHPELKLYLDVSRMGLDQATVATLTPAFQQAFQAMAELEAGAIANPDEDRMVGHYWLRDPDLAPAPELTAEIRATLEQIKTFVDQVHSGQIAPPQGGKFRDVISVGIGGSALGPQFVSQALAPLDAPLNIHFLDNTDPAGFDRLLTQLGDRLVNSLVLVVSKSGGTPETCNGMVEVAAAFQRAGLDFPKHAVAITMNGSKLFQIAQTNHWLAIFPMYDWVGGRTSELSAVGLLPAALQGIAIEEMLTGAKQMDAATRVPQIKTNPAALLALAWYHAGNGKGEKDMVVLPYKDSLQLFSRYLQQLVMESLGKEKDLDGQIVHQGIAVYGNKGTTDQHAYVQQLRDGLANFFLTFIEVLKDRPGTPIDVEPGITSGDYLCGLLLGTRQALYDNDRPSLTVTLPEVTPTTVGALIALYERAVGLYGFLVNVNAYHQPGVEAGKKAAAANLALQLKLVNALKQESGPIPLIDLVTKLGVPEQAEMAYLLLRHLAANDQRVELLGSPQTPGQLRVVWQG
ncbi:glucose-6-phosphate isomerase [Candidatus Synechococcus calcipolaris G9]|uniref:Glucose-6-phosphate isomerase n=1 Tax=Candidatus Synechococcus calcipolaris G9 TaxID=1497997 RepID=A0ABT6EZU5_9SYNE|nr:glucose-6-phosphate isomerase [Candidatus Synechococcus calcipolaris]MDG2991100.1 glucose-6-phosphate isomerase [Candidatus Synechococcus calcipolaris G9]